MPEKRRRSLLFKVSIVIVFILIANVSFIAIKYNTNFTGYSVSSLSEGFARTYDEISPISKMFFILQWVVIFVGVIFVWVYSIKKEGKVKEIVNLKSKKLLGKSATDLDTLYQILQEKKKLKISTVSRAFKIDEDIAMDWCKILESGNLAVIDYPGIGEPIIKIAE